MPPKKGATNKTTPTTENDTDSKHIQVSVRSSYLTHMINFIIQKKHDEENQPPVETEQLSPKKATNDSKKTGVSCL